MDRKASSRFPCPGVYEVGTWWSVAGSAIATAATRPAAAGLFSSTTRLAGNGFPAVSWAIWCRVGSWLASRSASSLLR